jgi:hypothetical protein
MITQWNALRNYSKTKTRNIMLEEIINGFNRSDLGKLIEIADGFQTLFDQFYSNADPEHIITMCIQEWCSRLMMIYDADDDKTRHIRAKFVTAHVAETLKNQELLTKREQFNWAIVFGAKKSASDNITNEEYIHEDSVGEKTEDPFSLDAYDVEGDINLNVGGDYGVD